MEGGVVVADMYDKIYEGTFVGGNLSTAIRNRTKIGGGVIFIPSYLVKDVIEAAKKSDVKDLFGFDMIKKGVYTTAEVDIDVWPTDMMDKLVEFIKTDERAEEFRSLDWTVEYQKAKEEGK